MIALLQSPCFAGRCAARRSSLAKLGADPLCRAQVARLEVLGPVLRWPRMAYLAKFNEHGSFYASVVSTNNTPADVGRAPGSASPSAGGGKNQGKGSDKGRPPCL